MLLLLRWSGAARKGGGGKRVNVFRRSAADGIMVRIEPCRKPRHELCESYIFLIDLVVGIVAAVVTLAGVVDMGM
jgi:uncharacterized membrane protein